MFGGYSGVLPAISIWCNISSIFAFEYKDLMGTQDSIQGGKKMKKIIHGLVITSCWCIWKSRNELVFKQIKRSPQDILIEIKSRGFRWLNNRSSCKYISWKKWCKYPMYML
ncbi:hypothetical protein HanIR_Chr17g0847831 [Helianthus annuus]|nr:hypothetical protein HanIR_Chr17g0847831 [Helianthus annuus]